MKSRLPNEKHKDQASISQDGNPEKQKAVGWAA